MSNRPPLGVGTACNSCKKSVLWHEIRAKRSAKSVHIVAYCDNGSPSTSFDRETLLEAARMVGIPMKTLAKVG